MACRGWFQKLQMFSDGGIPACFSLWFACYCVSMFCLFVPNNCSIIDISPCVRSYHVIIRALSDSLIFAIVLATKPGQSQRPNVDFCLKHFLCHHHNLFCVFVFKRFYENKWRYSHYLPQNQKTIQDFLQHAVYALLISNYLGIFSAGENFPTKLIMLLAGDIETNPGPATASCLKFCNWNLNSICARGGIKTT